MIVGATGHQKLPGAALSTITAGIRNELSGVQDLCGVCSLAVGADQLFAEQVLALKGRLVVVVPSKNYETTFTEDADLASYRRLLDSAREVVQMDFAQSSEEAFYAAGQKVVDLSERLVAVWDGEVSRGLGGTADIVRYAREHDKPVVVVWPEGVVRD